MFNYFLFHFELLSPLTSVITINQPMSDVAVGLHNNNTVDVKTVVKSFDYLSIFLYIKICYFVKFLSSGNAQKILTDASTTLT